MCTIISLHIVLCRFRASNRLITHTQAKGLGASETLLSKVPCMRFKAAEARSVARFYLHERVREVISTSKRSKYKPREVKPIKEHRIQPMNSAAAINLTAEPFQDRTFTKSILPRSLASLMEHNMPRGRGRIVTTPESNNTMQVCERVVGLDGYKLRDRVFRSALERRRHAQRKRRLRAIDDTLQSFTQ